MYFFNFDYNEKFWLLDARVRKYKSLGIDSGGSVYQNGVVILYLLHLYPFPLLSFFKFLWLIEVL